MRQLESQLACTSDASAPNKNTTVSGCKKGSVHFRMPVPLVTLRVTTPQNGRTPPDVI